ncbi:hypothetical protein DMUE_2660 [Dictyocoela muelleri]|nr:hypothetical protein DMUE_2660 [Dictyocoela muelleri]
MHDVRRHDRNNYQSIKGFRKSFIINYVLFNNPLDVHINLSSKRMLNRLKDEISNEEMTSKRIPKVDDKFEVALFEYKHEISGLKIAHKLNTLTSIKDQGLLIWRTCFNEVARICKYSEDAKMEVLTQIENILIQHQILKPADSTDKMNKILSLKYNPNNVHIYIYIYISKSLSKIIQNEYSTIREYLKEIEVNCQKIGMCLGWNDQITNLEIEETFFMGLNDNVKFELVKCSDRSFNNCFRILSDMDQLCIEKLKELIDRNESKEYTYDHERNLKNKNHTHSMQIGTNHIIFNSKKAKIEKHCSFQKSASHNGHECSAKKTNNCNKELLRHSSSYSNNKTIKEREKTSDNDEMRSYEIRESQYPPKILEIPIAVDGK